VHQYSLLFHSVAWQPGQRPITAAVCFVYLESLLCNPELEFGSCQEISSSPPIEEVRREGVRRGDENVASAAGRSKEEGRTVAQKRGADKEEEGEGNVCNIPPSNTCNHVLVMT
jgi:hypothetical protein